MDIQEWSIDFPISVLKDRHEVSFRHVMPSRVYLPYSVGLIIDILDKDLEELDINNPETSILDELTSRTPRHNRSHRQPNGEAKEVFLTSPTHNILSG